MVARVFVCERGREGGRELGGSGSGSGGGDGGEHFHCKMKGINLDKLLRSSTEQADRSL